MFKIFRPNEEEYFPPLSEGNRLGEAKLYIKRIQEQAYNSTRLSNINNSHPLVRLLKRLDNRERRNGLTDYLSLAANRMRSYGPTAGFVTEDTFVETKDMKLTSANCFDLVYLTDDYVSELDDHVTLRCLYHPFTHLNLLMPTHDWGESGDGKYTIWELNVHSLMRKWRKFVLNENDVTLPSHVSFMSRILSDAIPSIVDHSLMNRKQRIFHFEELDAKLDNPYKLFINTDLEAVRMYPQRTYNMREILFTLPSIQEGGLLDTLETPQGLFFKHQKVIHALARVEVFDQIAAVNRGKLPQGDLQSFILFRERLKRLSLDSSYGILPDNIMTAFLLKVDEIYASYIRK